MLNKLAVTCQVLVVCVVFLHLPCPSQSSYVEGAKACLLSGPSSSAHTTRDGGQSIIHCVDEEHLSDKLGLKALGTWFIKAAFRPQMLELHHVSLMVTPPPFVYARELRQVELFSVELSSLHRNSLRGLSNVHTMEILQSTLPTLHSQLLYPLHSLQHLTLDTTAPLELASSFFAGSPSLRSVYLTQPMAQSFIPRQRIAYLIPEEDNSNNVSRNTFDCSCKLLAFLQAQLRSVGSILPHGGVVGLAALTCSSPDHLLGRRLSSLSKGEICNSTSTTAARNRNSNNAKPRHIRSLQHSPRSDAEFPHNNQKLGIRVFSAHEVITLIAIVGCLGLLLISSLCLGEDDNPVAAILCCKDYDNPVVRLVCCVNQDNPIVNLLCCRAEKSHVHRKSRKTPLSARLSRTLSRIVHAPSTEVEAHLVEEGQLGLDDDPEETRRLEEEAKLRHEEEEEERRRVEEEEQRLAEEERLRLEEEERIRLAEEERWRAIKEERETEAKREQEQKDLDKGLRRALTIRRTVTQFHEPRVRVNSTDSDDWSSSSDSSSASQTHVAQEGGKEAKKKARKKKKEQEKTEETVDGEEVSTCGNIVLQRSGLNTDDEMKVDKIPMGIVERMAQTLAMNQTIPDVDLIEEASITGSEQSPSSQHRLSSVTAEENAAAVCEAGTSECKIEVVDIVKDEVLRMLMNLMGSKGMYGEGNLAEGYADCLFDSDEFDSCSDVEEEKEGKGEEDGELSMVEINNSMEAIPVSAEPPPAIIRTDCSSVYSGEYTELRDDDGDLLPAEPSTSIDNLPFCEPEKPATFSAAWMAAEAMNNIAESDIDAWQNMSESERQTFLASTLQSVKKNVKKNRRNAKHAGGRAPKKAGEALKKITRAVSMRRKTPSSRVQSTLPPVEDEITEKDLREWEDEATPINPHLASLTESRSRSKSISCVPGETHESSGLKADEPLATDFSRHSLPVQSSLSGGVEGVNSVTSTSSDFLDTIDRTAELAEKEQQTKNRRLSLRVRKPSFRRNSSTKVVKAVETREVKSSDLQEVDDWEAAKIGKNW